MASRPLELKLCLDLADLARLRRRPEIRVWRLAPPLRQRLNTIYWDTPGFDLAAAGVVVRIRAAGGRRRLSVKTAGSRGAGLFARREWEWPAAGEIPDPRHLAATGLPVLRDPRVAARLRPVFATDLRRTLYRLGTADWEATVALDHGAIGAGPAREAVCEAELSLVAGPPARLFDLAAALAAAVPARLMSLAKSDRGYRLAAGTPPLPVKAKPTALRADMTVAEAFRVIARNCLDQLLANERCLAASGDPEAIHQMRVALRRLRSAIRMFRAVVDGPGLLAVKAEIGWLLGHLGPARDGHVFLAEIVDPVVAAHPAAPPLTALRAAWLAETDRLQSEACAAVASRRFTATLLTVAAWVEAGDWLEAPGTSATRDIGPFARDVLARGDRRLRRAGGEKLSRLDEAALHRIRILAKQLRYAGEFFASLWPRKAAPPFLATVADLQEVLRQINDIAVARTRLGVAGTNDGEPAEGERAEGERAWAAGLIAGWHAGRRKRLLAAADKAWTRYRAAGRFWRKS